MMHLKKSVAMSFVLAAFHALAGRDAPWTKERAWEWYNAQPWIRGCNYMPASCPNRVAMWQALDAESHLAEADRELAEAEKLGFNAVRVIADHNALSVWDVDAEGFFKRFEEYMKIFDKHGIRAVVCLANDCAVIPGLFKTGPQPFVPGYHFGRRPGWNKPAPGDKRGKYLDDPELTPKFFAMCERLLRTYRDDRRVLFWNLYNEPNPESTKTMRALFDLAWKVDPAQPLATDAWSGRYEGDGAEALGISLSDIISYHCYLPLAGQQHLTAKLRKLTGRPIVATEWMARTIGCNVQDIYPFYAQKKIGCLMWGFVNGQSQVQEPWEGVWDTSGKKKYNVTSISAWFHDLLRPSYKPYDPEETDIIRNVNAEMDAEREGRSVRARIAAAHKIMGEDMWHGYRRTKFDFNGRVAWVVEPSVSPADGCPWTWTMHGAEEFVDRTGVLDLLRKGWHHVTLDADDTKACDEAMPQFAAFQKFLSEKLGLSPKACLVGLGWGGFYATRYAAQYPQNVARMYLDAPLLDLGGRNDLWEKSIGPWAKLGLKDDDFHADARMPVNMAEAIARAGIPVLLLYGDQDQVVDPALNCELFVERFKRAGGSAVVVRRTKFGHHPHGVDPDKTREIVDFFL